MSLRSAAAVMTGRSECLQDGRDDGSREIGCKAIECRPLLLQHDGAFQLAVHGGLQVVFLTKRERLVGPEHLTISRIGELDTHRHSERIPRSQLLIQASRLDEDGVNLVSYTHLT